MSECMFGNLEENFKVKIQNRLNYIGFTVEIWKEFKE